MGSHLVYTAKQTNKSKKTIYIEGIKEVRSQFS